MAADGGCLPRGQHRGRRGLKQLTDELLTVDDVDTLGKRVDRLEKVVTR